MQHIHNNFAHFWQHLWFSGIWNLEIWNLEIAWNWLILTNFNVLGIFPSQFLSLNLILCSEIQNSSFPEILPEFFWKSGKSLEVAVLGQFQHIRYHFHSVLVTEIDFEFRISKFSFPEKFSRTFLKIWKCFGNPSFGANSNILGIISTHWNWLWNQNVKNTYYVLVMMSSIWELLI